MTRLFSSFPGGSAGVGLLLLRVGVGVAMAGRALAALNEPHPHDITIVLAVTGLCVGPLMVLGLLTSYAGLVSSLHALLTGLLPLAGTRQWESVLLVALSAATLALTGPGACSIDARLFGRREIVVSPRPRGASHDAPRDQ